MIDQNSSVMSSRISGGYLLKARCIQNGKIANQPPYMREIWDWLLRNANFSTSRWNGFNIERGQLWTTYQIIRNGLKWHIGWRTEYYTANQVKKAMKFLRDEGMIETKKVPGGVLVTIINYGKYQDPKNYESTANKLDENSNGEPTENQSRSSNIRKKEYEQENNKEKLYSEFLDQFNRITDRSFKPDNKSKSQFYILLQDYTSVDFEKAIRNGFESSKSWPEPNFFTPGFITRQDKFELYLSLENTNKVENKVLTDKEVKDIIEKYFRKSTDYFIKILKTSDLEMYKWSNIIKSEKAALFIIKELHKKSGGDIPTAIAILNNTYKSL